MFLVNSSGDFFIRESLLYIYLECKEQQLREIFPAAAVLFDVYAGKEKTEEDKEEVYYITLTR